MDSLSVASPFCGHAPDSSVKDDDFIIAFFCLKLLAPTGVSQINTLCSVLFSFFFCYCFLCREQQIDVPVMKLCFFLFRFMDRSIFLFSVSICPELFPFLCVCRAVDFVEQRSCSFRYEPDYDLDDGCQTTNVLRRASHPAMKKMCPGGRRCLWMLYLGFSRSLSNHWREISQNFAMMPTLNLRIRGWKHSGRQGFIQCVLNQILCRDTETYDKWSEGRHLKVWIWASSEVWKNWCAIIFHQMDCWVCRHTVITNHLRWREDNLSVQVLGSSAGLLRCKTRRMEETSFCLV